LKESNTCSMSGHTTGLVRNECSRKEGRTSLRAEAQSLLLTQGKCSVASEASMLVDCGLLGIVESFLSTGLIELGFLDPRRMAAALGDVRFLEPVM